MDYTSDYSYQVTSTDASSGAAAGVFVVFMLIYLAVLAVMIVSNWKLFTKAGKPGWASIVPIYNAIVMLEILGRPIWWIVLLLIPIVNIVVGFIIVFDLVKAFGKETGWAIGLILLPIVFYPMLAFGNSKYVGPVAAKQ